MIETENKFLKDEISKISSFGKKELQENLSKIKKSNPLKWEKIKKIIYLWKERQVLKKKIVANLKFLETEGENKELQELIENENDTFKNKILFFEKEIIKTIVFEGGKRNEKVILEIREAAGGEESAIFVEELYNFYKRYAHLKRWDVKKINVDWKKTGRISQIEVVITGKNVFKFLKYEGGVHRIQRVPETEKMGRRHTSTVTVVVLPYEKTENIEINEKDLRIEVFRSSGAGGQHVNTTDSAVRITHIPTGIVASSQEERSQPKNRKNALIVLKKRYYQFLKSKETHALNTKRKEKIGQGQRHEKIRSYNFSRNTIKDHRIKLELTNLDFIFQKGTLDKIVFPLIIKSFFNSFLKKWNTEN